LKNASIRFAMFVCPSLSSKSGTAEQIFTEFHTDEFY
jgi:hypothetical protein